MEVGRAQTHLRQKVYDLLISLVVVPGAAPHTSRNERPTFSCGGRGEGEGGAGRGRGRAAARRAGEAGRRLGRAALGGWGGAPGGRRCRGRRRAGRRWCGRGRGPSPLRRAGGPRRGRHEPREASATVEAALKRTDA